MIRPAAPLPWRAKDWTSHAVSTVVIDDPSAPAGISIVADCEAYEPADRVRDAAYIAHAANAYPKLIEALRKTLGLANASRMTLQFDKTPVELDAEALLRELGEGT